MTEKMLSERQGRVGIMTFNNPEKHNAVSFEMWEAAERILDSFESDPEVRVVVLTGAGGKAFVSGADISKFESERASEEAVQRYNAMVEKVYGRIYRFPKPTIAMIRGYCIGGGLNLAICCDMRYATEGSRFFFVVFIVELISGEAEADEAPEGCVPSQALRCRP